MPGKIAAFEEQYLGILEGGKEENQDSTRCREAVEGEKSPGSPLQLPKGDTGIHERSQSSPSRTTRLSKTSA